MSARLTWIGLLFAQLSFFAVGGANAVIPEMQRHFVEGSRLLDGSLFASLVAIAQAAPGPNAMLVGLVGWHVAGAAGALVTTLAFCGPPAILTLLVGRVWGRLRATGIGTVVIEAAEPLTVGLVLASGWSLVRLQGAHAMTVAITACVTVGMLLRPALGLWLLGLGAAVAVVMGG